MVENHNPDNESKPLTTETEVLAPEATADHTDLSSESTSTQPPRRHAAAVSRSARCRIRSTLPITALSPR